MHDIDQKMIKSEQFMSLSEILFLQLLGTEGYIV